MKIPLGHYPLDSTRKKYLRKFGFDLQTLEYKEGYYYIEVPEVSQISYEEKQLNQETRSYKVLYNQEPILDVVQKISSFERYVECKFYFERAALGGDENAQSVPEFVLDVLSDASCRLM